MLQKTVFIEFYDICMYIYLNCIYNIIYGYSTISRY